MGKENHKVVLTVRVDPELKRILSQIAEARGRTVSDYAGHVLEVGLDEIAKRNLRVREVARKV